MGRHYLKGALLLALLGIATCLPQRRRKMDLSPEHQVPALFAPSALYAAHSFDASKGRLAVSGYWSFVKSAPDSALVMLTVAIPYSSLIFQRASGDSLEALYAVRAAFSSGRHTASQGVHGRLAVLSQHAARHSPNGFAVEIMSTALASGETYDLVLEVVDWRAPAGVLHYVRRITVPRFDARTPLTAVFLKDTFSVVVRSTTGEPFTAVITAKPMVAWGRALAVYFEAYPPFAGDSLYFLVETDLEQKHDVWSGSAPVVRNDSLATALVEIPTDTFPLGYLKLTVRDGAGRVLGTFPVVVDISREWVALNLKRVAKLLERCICVTQHELDSLRTAKGGLRMDSWIRFWGNHELEAFFRQVAEANRRFRSPNADGWNTDRGEMFLVLGEPDERHADLQYFDGAGRERRAEIWVYYRERRYAFFFIDHTGFDDYQLENSDSRFNNRGDFNRLRSRLRDKFASEH